MSSPIVFITTLQVQDGALERFKEATQRSVAFAEENGPHLMAGIYLAQDGTQAHGFQLHRDSESILSSWKMMDPHIKEVLQVATTTQVDIYGQPSDAVMEGMRRFSGGGATLTVTPRLAGFVRF